MLINKLYEKNQIKNKMTQNELLEQINEFNGYTQKEIDNLKSNKVSIAENNEDILNFVNKSKEFPGNFKMYLGKIKNDISSFIKSNFGIDIENYNISLKTDAIRHSINNHSNIEVENARGQVPITENDFLNIPQIINNPDKIMSSGYTKQGKPVIKFEKNIDGNNIVVTYISDKHNTLELQTIYKFKNEQKNSSATVSNISNTLDTTSETNSGTNFINNSIS